MRNYTNLVRLYKLSELNFPLSYFEMGKLVKDLGVQQLKESHEESAAIADNAAFNQSIVFAESMAVSDYSKAYIKQSVRENLTPDDLRTETASAIFRRSFSELLSTKAGNRFIIPYWEDAKVAEAVHWEATTNIYERSAIGEKHGRALTVSRRFNEPLNISGGTSASYSMERGESLSIREQRYRETANGVLSNISVSEGALNLDSFKSAADQIPGYAPFVEFKVGDYEYQKAIYRMVMKRAQYNSMPAFYDYAVHVDIPDTIDSGTAKIDGETKVYFNKHYYTVPAVNVAVIGGNEVLIPKILAVDGEDGGGRYFTVSLSGTDGLLKSGLISWTSRGY